MIVDPNDLRHDKRPRKKPIYKKKIVNEIKEVEVLDKVSKAIKSEIFNQEKLKQLKLKLKREEKKHE